MSKTIYIGGRLESKEKGNVVTGANAILDDTKGKKQNVINKETDDELLRLEQSKQDNLNFDNAPTEDSTNPVTSGGVYTAEKALSDAIEAILLLIPSAATALNKLVDTNTMNSSISMATATFRGTYNAVSDLGLTYQATHAQIEAALDALGLTADNNDFVFVQIPVSDQSQDIAKTERFKFNGTNWLYEYDLNTSGFTATQWAAINSTITLALVQKLAALPTNAELLQALGLKQDVLTFDNAPTTDSNNPVKSGGIKNAIDTAVGDEAIDRENADTALSDLIDDEKTRAEGVEGGLDTRLGAVEGSVSTIQGVIPSEATSSNKLVDNLSMTTYIGTIIENIDATFNVTSTDGHVTLAITQVNGVITSVQLTTSDIASAAALNLKASQADLTTLAGRVTTAEADLTTLAGRVTTAEGNITSLTGRVSTNETDITNLQQLYNNLQQSKPVPVTSLPSSGQQQGVIYRLAGSTSYSDYMWNGSTWVLMATYNNAIDDVPTAESNNLVKSGGVYTDILKKTTASAILNCENIVITERNINLLWDGSKFYQNTGNSYEGYVMKLEPGVYRITGGNPTIGIVPSYPKVNDTVFTTLIKNFFGDDSKWVSISETSYVFVYFSTGLTITIESLYKQKYNGISITPFISIDGVLSSRGSSTYNNLTVLLEIPVGISLKFNVSTNIGFSDTIPLTSGQNVGDTSVSAGSWVLMQKKYAVITFDYRTLLTYESAYKEVVEDYSFVVSQATLTKDNDSLPCVWDGSNFVSTSSYATYIFRCQPNVIVRVPKSIMTSQTFVSKPTMSNINALTCIQNSVISPYTEDYKFIHVPDNAKYIVFGTDVSVTSVDVCIMRSTLTPLKNKKIVFFGDSITEFRDTSNRSYTDYVSFFSGATCLNIGIGGTRLVPRKQNVAEITDNDDAYALLDILNMIKASVSGSWTQQEAAAEYIKTHASDDNTAIVARAAGIDYSTVDMFVIFGGINDFTANIQKGTYHSDDETTVCGAINKAIELLCTNYKKAIVVIITPEHRTFIVGGNDQYPDTWENSNSDTLWGFAESIEETANRQHCHSLNLMKNGVFNNYNHDLYFKYGINFSEIDQTHPYTGFYNLGKLIEEYLCNVGM